MEGESFGTLGPEFSHPVIRWWSCEEGKTHALQEELVMLKIYPHDWQGRPCSTSPPAMHKQQGVPYTRCPFVARSTGTVLHCFWKQKAATTLDSTISVTRPKLSSQKHIYLTSAVSLCKKKKSVPYFSKINAIVKSWQKIKVRTTLP